MAKLSTNYQSRASKPCREYTNKNTHTHTEARCLLHSLRSGWAWLLSPAPIYMKLSAHKHTTKLCLYDKSGQGSTLKKAVLLNFNVNGRARRVAGKCALSYYNRLCLKYHVLKLIWYIYKEKKNLYFKFQVSLTIKSALVRRARHTHTKN